MQGNEPETGLYRRVAPGEGVGQRVRVTAIDRENRVVKYVDLADDATHHASLDEFFEAGRYARVLP